MSEIDKDVRHDLDMLADEHIDGACDFAERKVTNHGVIKLAYVPEKCPVPRGVLEARLIARGFKSQQRTYADDLEVETPGAKPRRWTTLWYRE